MQHGITVLNSRIVSLGNEQQQLLHLFGFGMLAHLIERHNQIAQNPSNNVEIGAGFEENRIGCKMQLVYIIFHILTGKNQPPVKYVDVKLNLFGFNFNDKVDYIGEVYIAHPGYINIRLSEAWLAQQVETILAEKPITAQALSEASQAAMEACNPIDDVRASARYRKMMVRNLSLNALREVWEALRR